MRLELIELYPSPWSERLRWVLDVKVALMLVVVALVQAAHAMAPDTSHCGSNYRCYLRVCRKACRANRFCRDKCLQRWNACLHANGCDFTFPYCLTGSGFGCDPSSDAKSPAGCSVVRVINRTGETLANVVVNEQPTGADVPPRSSVKLFVPPSLSGVTVTADGTVSRDSGDAACVWSFTRTNCLDEQQRQRIVFRRGTSSCDQ